ncbi:hypothetical protein F511_19734 [Dorcoceras hygrometricum]|uniref:Uncharacterized protein n=1 Tax=Dorcoceras hygrometricum TaxID=472368 RepID=A0A2Z7A5T3_9LAMI|nr:hypothetical protein F511_19734 [Dorcoceras hygrometricum]
MGGLKVNWSKIPFGILKAMVDPSTKQASGFAMQIRLLMEGVLGIQLGESKALPSLKILSVKSVWTYVAKNKSSPAEFVEAKKEICDEAKAVTEAKMAAVEARATTAKEKCLEATHSTGEAVVVHAAKRKRTIVGREAPPVKAFSIVPAVVEAVPIQMVRPSSSTERKTTAAKRKLIAEEDSDSEDVAPLRKIINGSAKSIPVATSALYSDAAPTATVSLNH